MVPKCKSVFNICKCLYYTSFQRYKHTTKLFIYPLLSFSFWVDPHSLYERLVKSKCSTKTDRYWIKKKDIELIQEADILYEHGQYMEVYEILNRIKFNSNPEIQWRISRALFKMSIDENFDSCVREEMILEAYTLINLAISLEKGNANIYKWMAIITDAKCGLDGLVAKIKAYSTVKSYMEKALELNPNDMVLLYMLGKWCYEMSRLTWFQRIIAATLYESPPRSSYREAYGYLVRAAELQGKDYYIPTLYILGKTCIKLKQFFRARYYLYTASALTPRSEYEERCVKKSKFLLMQLDKYDVDKDCILYEYPVSDNV